MRQSFDIARVQEDFNRAALHYDRHAALQREVAEALCRKAKEYGLPQGTLLDLGSGTGYVAQCLERNIVQLDIAFNMCCASSRWGRVINADMESLPLRSGGAAGVLSSLALQWINHPEKVFAETYRALKAGGTCAMATFGPGSLSELRGLFGGINAFMQPMRLEKLLSDAGFRDLEFSIVSLTRRYPSIQALLRSIKKVGARGKYAGHTAQFPGKHFFTRLDATYRKHYGSESGLPGTWEVIYMLARK